MKRFKTIIVFTLLLVASTLATFAFVGCKSDSDNSEKPPEIFRYEERGEFGYAIFAANTNISGDIKIPTEYKGKSVFMLGEHAFEDCQKITSITIPEGVKTISYYAFTRSTAKTITIPISLKSIADRNAFTGSAIYRIDYSGTQEQWKQINGYSFVPAHIHVICADGELETNN